MSEQIETQVPITPQAFLDIAGVMFVALDKVGNVTLINQKGCDVLEYSQKEIVGKNWFDHFIPQAVDQNIRSVFQQLINGKMKPVEYYENPVLSKSGQEKIIAWHNTILKDTNGNIWGTLSSGEDITEKRLMQNKLKRAIEMTREAERAANLGSWSWNLNTNKVEWSDHLCEIHGLKPDEFDREFETVMQFIHPDDLDNIRKEVKRMIAEKKSVLFQYRILTKKGIEKVVEGTNRITLDQDGQVVQIVGTVQDITERIQLEENLKKEKEDLKLIIDSSPVIVFYKDRKGKVVRVNKAFAKALQMPEEEFVGKTVFDLYSPEIAKKMDDDDQEVFKTGCSKMNIIEQYESASGVRWVQTDKIPILDENGASMGLIGFAQDITERKKAEIALKENEKRYRRTLENMLEGCQIIDYDWRYIYVNKTVSKHGRKAKKELIGHTMMEAYPGIEKTEMFSYLRRCMEKRIPHRMENEFVYPDGEKRWFELSMQPVPEGVFILSLDITERKKAENRILHLNAVLIAIRNVSQLITQEKNPESLIQRICEALVETRRYQSTWIILLDDSGDISISAEAGIGNVYRSMVKKFKKGEIPLCARKALKRSSVMTISKPSIECRDCSLCRIHPENKIITVQLEYNRKVYGLINVSMFSELTIDEEEKNLFKEVADDIAFALHDMEVEGKRRLAEDALRDSEENFRLMVSEVKDYAIVMLDTKGFVSSWNEGAQHINGYRSEEVMGQHFSCFFTKEDIHAGKPKKILKIASEEGRFEEEAWRMRKEGTRFIAHVVITPICDEKGRLKGYSKVTRDITENKKAEETLKRSEERFRTFIERAPVCVFVHDLDGRILLVNTLASEYTGYTKEELLKMNASDIDHEIVSQDHRKKYWEKLNVNEYVKIEGIHERKDNTIYPAEIQIVKIIFRDQPMILAFVNDITERKQAEDQIKKDLNEKEILLREIHHRVKNNLQIIKSLLNLQSYQIKNETVTKAFNECVNRIQSMAMVHEQLYYSSDFTNIPFNAYIEKISRELIKSFKLDTVITVDLKVKDIFLSIDKAIPLGLIINELLTNALKYAFRGRKKGRITISLQLKEDQSYELIFQDNGVGFPKNVDFKETESLGLYLVKILTEQIDGVITVNKQKGTVYQIVFPRDYSAIDD